MPKRQSKRSGKVRAIAYYRMSSAKQEASIDQQREQVVPLAAKMGAKIVREYVDEGISGDQTSKRKAFQRMIEDAKQGEFDVIFCWDQDRFGRFDPVEANFYWCQLRDAGVRIVTVRQGELRFDELGGWLTASVVQYGKKRISEGFGQHRHPRCSFAGEARQASWRQGSLWL